MNTLVIKKEDLKYNIEQIRKLVEKNGKDDEGNYIKIIAVLKDNAYGVGLVEYAKFLIKNGITFFAVGTIEEGIKLREAGIKEEILMLSSTALKEDIENLIKNDIIITLGSKDDAIIADQIGKKQNKKVRAHISIDTGKGINGFLYTKREEIIETLKTVENIKIEGIYSEFVDSANNEKYTKIQFQRFLDVIEVLQMNDIKIKCMHICDSSAFFKFSNMNLNAVRIGKSMLGECLTTNSIYLRKCAYIETKVAEIKTIPKGFYLKNKKNRKEIKIAKIPCNSNLKEEIKYIKINKKNYKILGNIENNIICDIGKSDIKMGEKIIIPINCKDINSHMRREYR